MLLNLEIDDEYVTTATPSQLALGTNSDLLQLPGCLAVSLFFSRPLRSSDKFC